MEKQGIEAIKSVVETATFAANIAGKIMEDGEVGFQDLMQLPPLLTALVALTKLDLKSLSAQVLDLDAAEKEVLVKLFEARLDLPNDGIEAKLEVGVKLVADVAMAIKGLLAVIKK